MGWSGGAIESNGDSTLTAQLDDSAKARDLPQPSAAFALGKAPVILTVGHSTPRSRLSFNFCKYTA